MTSDSAPSAFALIGAAGFVAPRHMQAMKDVGGDLIAALDPADSVGILDRYFPDARFFVEFERFDRHIDKRRRNGEKVDYVSVCSPNYLHDAHVRFALRSDADAICEKPLVLNPWNVDGLADIERGTGRKVNTILQLRLHPAIVALRDRVANAPGNRVHDVELTYIASRGRWYTSAWKGDENKSGGIATNIGVHFYDMLSFVFGSLKRNVVHSRTQFSAAGGLEYDKANVRWFLSIDRRDLPSDLPPERTTFRSMTVDGEEIDFSGGFTNLHTLSYQEILKGRGFGLEDVRPCIEAVSHIRTARIEPHRGDRHPFLTGDLHGSPHRKTWAA